MTECPKCRKMIHEAAWEVHHELNHLKRHRGNLDALAQARLVLATKRAERRIRTHALETRWNGQQGEI